VPRLKRRPPTPPPAAPPRAPVPDTLESLRTQLKLARAQNVHLHSELARALKHGPLAPPDAATPEGLALALQTLRERFGVLQLHYEDAQQKIAHLTYSLALRAKLLGEHLSAEEEALVLPGLPHLDGVLKHLLTLAHPDKWSAGQSALDLAHVLTRALNDARETLAE
jgi:hypothetical protein